MGVGVQKDKRGGKPAKLCQETLSQRSKRQINLSLL